MMTITGIATAMINIGQRLLKSQPGVSIIATIKTRGIVTEAVIDARETYRQIRTTTIHVTAKNKAQTVK